MIDRRTMITAALAVIITPISTRTALAEAAICRIAGIVDRVSGSRPDDNRCPLERLRRTGTRRPDRDSGNRATPIWSYLSDRSKSHRKGPECPSILQMG